jgi:hypothetical protein
MIPMLFLNVIRTYTTSQLPVVNNFFYVKRRLCCCRTVDTKGSFEETPLVPLPLNQAFNINDGIFIVNCTVRLYIFIHLETETKVRI